ncbi:MAG: sulfurtransferase complex subunit TusC [Methylococcales bacterium]
MKNFLFILNRPLYQGAQTRESLEQLMVVAAFEQPVAVLFVDDAVFQLSNNQASEAIQSPNIGKILQALPLYDITQLFVEDESLNERGLSEENLILPVEIIHRNQFSSLLNQYNQVVNC